MNFLNRTDPKLLSAILESKDNQIGDGVFIKEKREVLLNKDYRVVHRSKEVLLNYLKVIAIRQQFKNDLGLYDRFWKKGYIVSTKSTRDLSEDFGYSSTLQIRNMIDELKELKEIYTSSVPVGKIKHQNVYILGFHTSLIKGPYEELFFTEINYNKNIAGDIKQIASMVGADFSILEESIGLYYNPVIWL